MVGGRFLLRATLRQSPSPSPSSSFHIVMPFASFLCRPGATVFKRYSRHHVPEERAPSTAEEFKKVAEEKLRSFKKAYDGPEEAVNGDSNVESDKKNNEEQERKAENRRRGERDRDV